MTRRAMTRRQARMSRSLSLSLRRWPSAWRRSPRRRPNSRQRHLRPGGGAHFFHGAYHGQLGRL